MSYPASLTLLTLTGQFLDGGDDGVGRAGSANITLAVPIRSTGDNVIIPPFDVDVELDVDGAFSIELPALTDPEWIPNTAQYIVQVWFEVDFKKLWWAIDFPYDAVGGTIDLADCGMPNVGTPSATVIAGTTTVTQDGGYRDTWDNGTVYRAGDTVQHDSAVWGALRTSAGIEPGTNGDVWAEYAGGGGAVASVFGRTGIVTAQTGDYTKTNVGLSNVDNTADTEKPVSTLQAAADAATLVSANAYTDALGTATTTALAGKASTGQLTAHEADTTAVHGIADTTALVLTGDARLSNTRTPTDGTVTTAKIVDSNVTLAKFANIASATILGNNTGGAAAPIALTTAQIKTLLGVGTYRGDWDSGTTYNPGDTVTFGDALCGTVNGASAGQTPWTQRQLYSGTPGSTDGSDSTDYMFRGLIQVTRKLRVDGLVWYKAASQTAVGHELRVYDIGFGATSILCSALTLLEGAADVGYKIAPVTFDMLPSHSYAVALVEGLTGDVGYHYSSGFSFPVTLGSASLVAGGFVASHANIATGLTNAATHLYSGVNIRYQDPHANWAVLARWEAISIGSSRALLAAIPPAI